MYTIALLLTIVAAVSAHPGMGKCGRLFHPGTEKCCTKLSEQMNSMKIDLKDCFDMPMVPHSCDREICVAKKKGFLSGTSSFDKEALKALLEKDYNDEGKEIKELIKEKCIDGNIEQYGPPDACDLLKLNHCMKIKMLSTCPEWDDSGDCSGMKELAEECTKTSA